MAESNPLISTKPSDSNLQVALHPLVLLTISDHITRHQVRRESGVVVGALLGQQVGRTLTIEHAFPCNVIEENQQLIIHSSWFEDRVKQYKDVHKQPALEVVGWFTVTPSSGPTVAHLPIHQQILSYNESPVLLAFHPSALDASASNTTGKLPLTLYESIEDIEVSNNNADKSKDSSAMQLDGDDAGQSIIKFRELSYTVETEETEMIGIDYVAKGGGNATAIDAADSTESSATAAGKGKRRAKSSSEETKHTEESSESPEATDFLSSEDEDLIATITTRLNSVRMLQSRVSLLQKFIQSLPPSYLSEADKALTAESPSAESLPYLRQINALVARLSLLTPSPVVTEDGVPTSQAEANLTAQANDVNLTSLLALLSRNIQGANELGKKFSATESIRTSQKQGGGKLMMGGKRFDYLSEQGFVEPDFDMA